MQVPNLTTANTTFTLSEEKVTNKPITVTINIDNLAKDRAISVSLTDRTNISGVSIAREYDSSSFSENTFSKTIAGGQTGTFTFTLTLANKNNDISGIFNIDLNLANSNQPSSTYTVDVSVESSFVIPLYVRIDGGEETIRKRWKRYDK